MLNRVGAQASKWAERWLPDPFVLAIGLTALSVLIALPHMDWSLVRIASAWVDGEGSGRGLWSLLAFGMQMCLILITGHALAETNAVRSLVDRLAGWPTTTRSAVVLVASVTMGFSLINWGLGLIIGALLAREVGRLAHQKGVVLHYPLVVTAGYTGMLVWHGGLSGSAPLKATSTAQLTDVLGPELAARIPPMLLGDTLGSPLNLVATGLCLVVVPLVLMAMIPSEEHQVSAPLHEEPLTEPTAPTSPSERINHSRWVVLVPVGLVLLWLIPWLRTSGIGRLNPDVMNLMMLAAGLALHGSARAYAEAVDRATRSCSGIILQYPFYAGIMGILATSGLVESIGSGLSNMGPQLLPVATFYLAGAVNLFVPSGGGQWAIQGPLVMEAALHTGVEPARVLMALAWGDQWTNMVQPFWALPLLGICKVPAGSILGYTLVLLLVSQFCFILPLLVL
ncbi:MAG: TIGR00366 family protein [Myxococcota bacterium]|nr:TIGR00366 family protein [Myxococcota bacterium]